jgi:protocatechuate 3,4-dioxygenase beta subunit
VTETTRRQAGGWRSTIADVKGLFRFENLPPGDYRLLATFDASEATAELMEEAQAGTIRLEPEQVAGRDLPLWVAP